MTGHDLVSIVDEDRIDEPEPPDAGRDLGDLLRGMFTRVPPVGLQFSDGAPFDFLIGIGLERPITGPDRCLFRKILCSGA
jgi:hypothetical protein